MREWHCDGICVQNHRPTNMDSIFYAQQETVAGRLLLAVVCDGVGSTKDGAFASNYCTCALGKWFQETDGYRLGLTLRDKVLELNREIIAEARAKELNAATTLSALLITEDGYIIVHAGDSRIYHWNEERLTCLTQDHVSDQGRLTACIGRWSDVVIQYEEGELPEGGFLLCSDGLYKHIPHLQLQSEVTQIKGRRQKREVEKLLKLAVDQSETDNISIILLQNRK